MTTAIDTNITRTEDGMTLTITWQQTGITRRWTRDTWAECNDICEDVLSGRTPWSATTGERRQSITALIRVVQHGEDYSREWWEGPTHGIVQSGGKLAVREGGCTVLYDAVDWREVIEQV